MTANNNNNSSGGPSPPSSSSYFAASCIPIRLLSSVAVVGRDNEPIYLRGDLCDCIDNDESSKTTLLQSASDKSWDEVDEGEHDSAILAGGKVNDKIGGGVVSKSKENDEGSSSPTTTGGDSKDDTRSAGGGDDGNNNNNINNNRGLFGRFKKKGGGMATTNNNGESNEVGGEGDAPSDNNNGDNEENKEEEDDDPFGFFGNSTANTTINNAIQSNINPIMSLTQQLVLHASLDRFEEIMTRSSSKGGGGAAVRWRTPGISANSSNNGMWMGLLCRVEERWDVYGALFFFSLYFCIYMLPAVFWFWF